MCTHLVQRRRAAPRRLGCEVQRASDHRNLLLAQRAAEPGVGRVHINQCFELGAAEERLRAFENKKI